MKIGLYSVSVYYATGYAPMAEYTGFINDEHQKGQRNEVDGVVDG